MKLSDVLSSYENENGDIIWNSSDWFDLKNMLVGTICILEDGVITSYHPPNYYAYLYVDLEDDVDPSHYEIRITI
ncbi:MAG TPA: hypothetical protein PLD02_09430 [Saprospiraceae bacterium]|nr:hypothetical protein [Saprospiraceae bacterium]